MKPRYVVYDNLDDRREILHLLKRLDPQKRVGFVQWLCRQAVLPNSAVHPRVARKTVDLAARASIDDRADTALTIELFTDIWHLSMHYKFDLDAILLALVERVKGRELWPLKPSSPDITPALTTQ